jgi:hypothetical protein
MNAALQSPMAVPVLLAGLGLQLAIGLVAFGLSGLKPSVMRSALLMQLLVGVFCAMVVLTPWLQAEANAAGSTRLVNLAVFLALLAMLKLLGRFEE